MAALSLLGSATLFAAMALLARLVSRTIPGPQVALVRFSIGVLVVVVAWLALRVDLRPRRWRWLVVRGACGGLAVLLYFSCIERLGVGRATLLNYTAPVWSLVFAWLLLGERPSRHVIPALLLTLVGVVLIVGHKSGGWQVGGWDLAAVASAVVSGMAVTSIRGARRPLQEGPPAESYWSVFASFTVLGTVATLGPALGPWGRWVPPSGREWLLLVCVAATSIVAQLIMTSALRHVTAVASGTIHQVTVVLAVLGGIIFFGEGMTPFSALGSVLTVGGVLWVVCLD